MEEQKKKVLWICNIMLPAIAKELHMEYSNREGWLSGIYEKASKEEFPFELGICFPVDHGDFAKVSKKPGAAFEKLELQNVTCYAFREKLKTPEIYDAELECCFKEIFADFNPDMIHVFGTEFPHTLAAVKVFDDSQHTLIGIQGLCSEIAKCYRAGLPEKVWNKASFRDVLRKDSMRQQQIKFQKRGQNEIEAIQKTGNITGRTAFDKEKTEKINPAARYYAMNETMRTEFYDGKWEPEQSEQYRIFLGQGDYPLKGTHFLLKAMGILKQKYPDLQLYVAGNSIIRQETAKDRLKLPAYGEYLLKLIKKYGLENHVHIAGRLSAQEMKEQFMKCSVFVCPSVVENSPNTIGEAMLLGVPVVASEAGGIPSMVENGNTGLLFKNHSSEELADAIASIWENPEMARELSAHERVRASFVHDSNKNYDRLMEIYISILSQ